MDTQVNTNLNNFRDRRRRCRNSRCRPACRPPSSAAAPAARSAWSPRAAPMRFHGTLFEYLRNSDFDATDFFINKAKGTKTPAASQPVRRHRSAVPSRRTRRSSSWSYEEFRQVAPTVSSDAGAHRCAARAGDRSHLRRRCCNSGRCRIPPSAPTTSSPTSAASDVRLHRPDPDRSQLQRSGSLTGRFADYQGTSLYARSAAHRRRQRQRSRKPQRRPHRKSHFQPDAAERVAPRLFAQPDLHHRAGHRLERRQDFPEQRRARSPGVVDGTKNIQDSGLPTVTISGGYAPLGSTTNLPQGRITNTTEIFDNISWVAPVRQKQAQRSAPAITSAGAGPPLPRQHGARVVQLLELGGFRRGHGQ